MNKRNYYSIDDNLTQSCREQAAQIRATVEAFQKAVSTARAGIAADVAKDKALLEKMAVHSDRTNQAGRE